MPPYDWANGDSADVFLGWWYGFSTVGEQKIHYIRIKKQAQVSPFPGSNLRPLSSPFTSLFIRPLERVHSEERKTLYQ